MKALTLLIPFSLIAQTSTIELSDEGPFVLECTGKHRIVYNNGTGQTDAKFSKKAIVQEKNFGLIWGDEINPYQDFSVIPQSSSRVLLNGIQYPGSLHFTYGKKVINKVDVDVIVQVMMQQDHLSTYSLETLKAIAIALRTDLCYDTRTIPQQELNYQGQGLLYQYPKIVEAIVETKSLVMTLDDKLFPTTYCKDAGGTNATFGAIFRDSIETPSGCKLPVASTTNWKKRFQKQNLENLLNCQGLKNLAFYKDKASEKVYAVKLEDKSGSRVIMIQRFMNMLELNSNHFNLSNQGDEFTFTGQGEGLGVGLCLKTAESLASKGLDAKQILKACYPGISFSSVDK